MGLLSKFKKKKNLKVPKEFYEDMIEHAKLDYPHECCGVLIGNSMMGVRKIFHTERCTNLNRERAHDRYLMDPREINLADKGARAQSLEIMGFYHSHPDHPDRPSEYDREVAHPGYSYIIMSVKGGKDVSVKSWKFEDEDGPFEEEGIEVTVSKYK